MDFTKLKDVELAEVEDVSFHYFQPISLVLITFPCIPGIKYCIHDKM